VDDIRENAMNAPSIGGGSKDASRSKKGGIRPIKKDVNLP
jgi:hypothetical protein